MTQDEIIEMAREAGIMSEVLQLGRNLELLTDFAKLVVAKEREECALMVMPLDESLADTIRARGKHD
jgi:hypothetical protein